MKHFLIASIFSLLLSSGLVIANENVSDEKISEISQRLENYSVNALVERRDFLISYKEDDDENDNSGIPAGSASERAL